MPADVGDLLRRSRLANDAFHSAQRLKNHTGASDAVILARRLRVEADKSDPGHTNPEWANDKAPHAEIMSFYNRYLGIAQ
jgi:hypothetical protein